MIDLTAERIELAQMMLGHIPGAVPQALTNAINRSAEGARTDAVAKAKEEYVITAGRIRATIGLKKANASNLSAAVISRGRPNSLSYFKLRPGKATKRRPSAGIFAQVKRSGGGPIAKSFIAKMANGHEGVFNRTGAKRMPIVERYGPSAPQMLENESVSRYVEAGATRRLDERLGHEINRLLERYGK
ncbi:phage tail protein [Sporomusa acidovorans]|uniref:Prophage minor tail protein Z n=1 Tax=Sporomusa acidovorans (strain ATCC 49682 / DSM 3132 / Mol) TaxID=1123286 RepID=A0ABZ3J949_SPOA4|nr:phage tail protein [Sporomusa acidovorans]OZC16016.1 prophage minor tail protein Z [Sporomusa acidovorans DSM 3132]SDD89633.1 Prophage minor tail protein Z (GPZ) [Sporomusa acidovorans]